MTETFDFETTDDGFFGGALRLLQPRLGFRAGSDAVLLSASLAARPGARVLDAGAGTGIVALAAAHRLDTIRVEGLDVDADLVALARENALRNGLADRVGFSTGDLLDPPAADAAFDHVLSNPPFHDPTKAPPAADARRARARHGSDLGGWIAACLTRLRPGGELRLILPAARLGAALAAFGTGTGRTVVFPLRPRAGRDAKRIILCTTKGARAPLRLAAGLTLHDAGRAYTEWAEAVLRHGAVLDLDDGTA